MKIVIRCGGAGTRLWPLSRTKFPKQFQPLLGSRTLFESKLEEIRPLLRTWDDLYISTIRDYVPFVRRFAPRVHPDHIIAEPVRRNTGPGIALETIVIDAHTGRSHDPVIASLTVDDVMQKVGRFRTILRAATQYLEEDDPFSILTIACPVSTPDTGLSYLALGRTVRREQQFVFRRVTRWIEKPTPAQLVRLLRTSTMPVHTGLYLWHASTVLSILEEHEPAMYTRLQRISRAVGTRHYARVLERTFPSFPIVSAEQLITRHAPRIIAAVADLGWKDTGKWFLIHELRRRKPGANVIEGSVVAIDTNDSLIYAPRNKVVATVGLDGFIVVDTGDALLVCPKARSDDVKKVVEHLKRIGNRTL